MISITSRSHSRNAKNHRRVFPLLTAAIAVASIESCSSTSATDSDSSGNTATSTTGVTGTGGGATSTTGTNGSTGRGGASTGGSGATATTGTANTGTGVTGGATGASSSTSSGTASSTGASGTTASTGTATTGTTNTGTSVTGGTTGTTGSTGRGGTSTGGSASTATTGTTSTAATGGASGSTGATGTGGATTSTGTGGTGSTCPGTLKAGDSNQTIMSGGMSRKFIVHLPKGYTGSSALPVIFDFHPLGGTGQSQEQASGWGTKCDSVGCIAVFPDSGPSDNSWNVGYCCSNAQQQKVDDVQFTRDMIKWLEANSCVDPKRIYASGCSNGGGMSYMLACNAADVIAAVAPVDFRCITGAEPASASSLTSTNNTACTCTLPRPISVTSFDEGQDNSIVPYNGGKTVVAADCPPGGSCSAFNFPSAQVNFGTWANFDKCTGSPTTSSSNSICQTYASCADNTEVTLCTAPSPNHCGSYGLAKIVDTAWNQFQKESLP